MFSAFWTRRTRAFLLPAIAATLGAIPISAQAPQRPEGRQDRPATVSFNWQSSARMHRTELISGDHGTLLISSNGVEFRTGNQRSLRWTFAEIRTVFIAPHRLVVGTYLNRSLHRPGECTYRFSLEQAVPPAVAAGLAEAVARPSQNADPDPKAPAIATIPVRHRALASGTNGVLRFRLDGIDYVTASREDSRSWRWADLQTVSDPGPWRLLVFGYRDTYTFDLKAPLSRKLLDWAADEIFAHGESENAPASAGMNEPESGAAGEHHE